MFFKDKDSLKFPKSSHWGLFAYVPEMLKN